ncbi:MAG: hypothetical protein B6242_14140 [Anaerolineaceae bacterium 4572_78]|nr:MAG: hypothetical protein B6242_14140 [Anaerolineaceae bacterium 4572_78]
MKNMPTSKPTDIKTDDMESEYVFDYSKARPNRFAEKIKKDSVVVVLDPDVAQFFATSETVNAILRGIMSAMQNIIPTRKLESTK